MADGTTIPLNEENYKRIFAEAKKAHEVFTHKAADAGTRLHSALEKFCLNEPQVIDPDIQDQYNDFLRWADEYKMRPMYTERMVFSHTHGFAGQFDLMAMLTIPGRGEVVFELDFKSAKRVYDSHAIQAAGYKIAHDDQYGPMIEEIGVLVMPRVGTGLVWADCSGHLPVLEKAFMDCLNLYNSMKPVASIIRKINKG